MKQLNSVLSAHLPEDEFDTVGGFVLHLFGKLPERGEETFYEGYKVRVENVGRTRILKIRIERGAEPVSEQ